MHSGIAITPDGTIYCAHPQGRALLVIDPEGATREVPTALTELHGIARTSDDGVLAVADPGYRMLPGEDAHYEAEWKQGRAVLLAVADGRIVVELAQPDLPVYSEACWRPTSIDVDRGQGGTDEVWVADGYGADLVHRYASDGTLLGTYDGSETGARFSCPHGIVLRRRGDELRALVADRSNHRIVVLDQDGRAVSVFGEDQLDSPSSFALLGEDLFVTELFGGVAQFDREDSFVRRLEPRRVRSHEGAGWPNRLGEDGEALFAPDLVPATFNSPHGIAAHEGDLVLTEWLIGGRLVRVTP
ncbi:hypothetical protein [Microbacterium atlanticum]|uniref:hypothetical protein n=1 Tax=Microbacterium atlanticum TaxID=2782168 RepID=UPI001887F5D0|nr:hypothetical protein [Microbacterium atlanticum]